MLKLKVGHNQDYFLLIGTTNPTIVLVKWVGCQSIFVKISWLNWNKHQLTGVRA
jgi:hypothetical protein